MTLSDQASKQLAERFADGSINEQGVWSYLREANSSSAERLQATAIIDCTREYTFAQMFAEWERYARVFGALGMTGEEGSRVAIGGTISAEPLFAFYALNMTGAEVSMFSYPDFLPGGKWETMAEVEHVTDLVLSDIMISPDVWPKILEAKERLGIRNVVLLHSRLGGPCAGPAELIYNEANYRMLRALDGVVFMSDLLPRYQDAELCLGSGDPQRIAIITHTSGTTKGTRKPLPYTNWSVNQVATGFVNLMHATDDEARRRAPLRIAPSFDFSSFLCMCGAVNAYLVIGGTVVLTFFGFMHPKYIRAIEYYRLEVVFTSGFLFDSWINRTDIDDVNFSSVRSIACGGSYVSLDKLQKYEAFARAHGYAGGIARGYGMSETGGAQLATPDGCHDDIVGFPQPEEDYLIFDENDGAYHRASEGERTGVLYITSPTMCLNVLDGQTLFEFTQIDGRSFICTNDLMRVNADGSFSYAGRADRYFVNNEGVRFNPAIVEQRLSDQPQVEACAVVPVLDKRIHDTVPALYVVPEDKGSQAAKQVHDALAAVYFTEGLIATSNLPSQLILVDSIPCNANGKIDIYRITRDRLQGEAYDLIPVHTDGKVTDVALELNEQLNSITGGTLPEGMGSGSALDIYGLFNAPSAKRGAAFAPFPRPPIPFSNLRSSLIGRSPFMDTSNPSAPTSATSMPALQLMQQACNLQMQIMQCMCLMPLSVMQAMTNAVAQVASAGAPGAQPGEEVGAHAASARPAGFKLGNWELPPELLSMLLNIDMSPENLEKLQRTLDFAFEALPQPSNAKH